MDGLPAVEFHNLVKQFGTVLASDHVNLSLAKGEIHALLGENGAGKSTVMCMLSGVYRPTSGEIRMNGTAVKIHSPKDAAKLGIGMVFQNFRLVQTLTAAENVVLGDSSPFWRTRRWMERKTKEIEALALRVGLPFAAGRPVAKLSVGEQQRVEIVKCLYRGNSVLILDEPTSVLTPAEADQLFTTLRKLKSEGKTIILTTHKLKEVMAVADRISVMRKGQMLATLDRAQTSEREIARLMVGQDRSPPKTRVPREPGEPLLIMDKVTVVSDRGRHALDEVSLTLNTGEIVGIAGVAGNGQKELAEVLAGLHVWKSGTITFREFRWKGPSVRGSIKQGIAHVPEDRMISGLAGGLGSVDNLLVKSYHSDERANLGFLRTALNRLWSQGLVEQFDVRTAHLDAPVKQMSGGNQQKLLFAREIHQRPHLLIAVHPSQGLDVGATDAVHNLLLGLRAEGRSVLLISEDLDELLLLADRIVVLFAGRVMGEMTHERADREQLGMMMAGVT
jgi:simple sugar transport system ATP-binding protein